MLTRIYSAALSALLFYFASHSSFAQTTLGALTSNNTAACPASGTLPPHCQAYFAGQADNRTGIATQLFNRPPANVSDEDPHGYLQGGSGIRIFANLMLAFCVDSKNATCHGNVQTGYTSGTLETVGAQIEDLRRRHIDGAIMTWEGAGTTADLAILAYQQYVNQIHCSGPQKCNPSYLLMYDGPSLEYTTQATGVPGTSNKGCPETLVGDLAIASRLYEDCVLAHVKNDICYMNGKHWGNDAYEKFGGHPVVQVFTDEFAIPLTGSAPSWEDIWVHLEDWNADIPRNCNSAPWNANNGRPLLIFERAGGFNHPRSDGSFYWINAKTGIANQMVTSISPSQVGGTLEYFYQLALGYQGKLVWGAAFKGFNDTMAPWGNNRVMDQQCGQTWIKSLQATSQAAPKIANFFLQVVTWNDYSEGTEIESGIDNCYTVSTRVAGTTLTWALDPTNAYFANLSTVSHIEIYDSTDGANLTLLANAPAQNSGTISLSGLHSGKHHLFVRMVGKNSIINRISPDTAFTQN